MTCNSTGTKQLPGVCNCCLAAQKGCTIHLRNGGVQKCPWIEESRTLYIVWLKVVRPCSLINAIHSVLVCYGKNISGVQVTLAKIKVSLKNFRKKHSERGNYRTAQISITNNARQSTVM
jgi:hypothetical protein